MSDDSDEEEKVGETKKKEIRRSKARKGEKRVKEGGRG